MENQKLLPLILGAIAGALLLTNVATAYNWYIVQDQLNVTKIKLSESENSASDLQGKLITESMKRAGAQESAEKSAKDADRMKENAELMGALGVSLAGHMDNMDKLLIDIDDVCVDTINWYYDNAQFTIADGTLDTANTLLSAFKMDHKRHLERYTSIKSGLDKDVEDFKLLVDFYATYRSYEDSQSEGSRVR